MFQCGVEVGPGFGRWDVADGFKQAPVIEPVDLFEGDEIDCFDGPPRPASVDDLSLAKTIDAFDQGVAIAVSDAAD